MFEIGDHFVDGIAIVGQKGVVIGDTVNNLFDIILSEFGLGIRFDIVIVNLPWRVFLIKLRLQVLFF
jgi:hypothetical protein